MGQCTGQQSVAKEVSCRSTTSSTPRTLLTSRSARSQNASTPTKSPTPARKRMQCGHFILGSSESFNDFYDTGDTLGKGAYGLVCRGTRRQTGAVRAIKTVAKNNVTNLALFREEINIMRQMDHPNVIKLFETFEENRKIYLVMELCVGGELFDRIIEVGHFAERDAAIVMQQILRAVFHLHGRNVAHRDLKPENFIFSAKAPIESNVLKLIDFGLSCASASGTMHTELVGSAQYVAPQVVTRKYDRMCDLWSCGVILHILLCGKAPFTGKTDKEIMWKVRKAKTVKLCGPTWEKVSEDGKDLTLSLLRFDPTTRPTAETALGHVWIQMKAPRAEAVSINDKLVDNLKEFREQSRLKKAALRAVAAQLEDDQTSNLRRIFTSLDKNGDGTLTQEDLRDVTSDLKRAVCRSGVVNYTEFLAANLDKMNHLSEDVCRAVFDDFDLDGDGRISRQDIRKVLNGEQSLKKKPTSSTPPSVSVDYEGFLKMMNGGTFAKVTPDEKSPPVGSRGFSPLGPPVRSREFFPGPPVGTQERVTALPISPTTDKAQFVIGDHVFVVSPASAGGA